MVRLVGRREHLGLVDVVDTEMLQHLRLDHVTDPRLRHDRDGDRTDDRLDHLRVAHACDATIAADVGGHALEGHDRDRTSLLSDTRLLDVDDVHDDAALEHVGESALHTLRAGDRRLTVAVASRGHAVPSRRRAHLRGSGRVLRLHPRGGGEDRDSDSVDGR